ncbi:hypothetical protein AB0M39_32630 [Streptomyces sp. NPDC051907]|uniref:hypothetical protein n=1 Tax=Streptomyces sp. NPDC051907 TaxID=3155284 RepID=UPI00341A6724
MSTSEGVKAVIPAPRTSPENDPPQRAGPPRAPRWLTAVAATAVLVLLGGGAGLLLRAGQLSGSPAAENRALTDTEATARVIGDVGGALTEVFSYRPDNTAATRLAARELLAGKAARQYGELFGQVEKRAAEQRLTLTTHVVRAGVTRLSGRSARLLVFLDQVAERRGKPPATAAAQLTVAAELTDGRWQIVDITAR